MGSGDTAANMSMTASTTTSGSDQGAIPIYLNVYDLTPMNGYVYWLGLGIYHSGIEAHGVEYAFGAHDFPTSGVFEVEPRNCPGFTYRTTLLLGKTTLSDTDFRTFVEQCAEDYNGDTYHLIVKNCNHFSSDISTRLTGNPIPGWVNRLARLGWFCNCLLPESLQVTAVGQSPEAEECKENGDTVELVDSDAEDDQRLPLVPNGDSRMLVRDHIKISFH